MTGTTNNRRIVFHFDVGPEPDHFRNVLETIEVDGIGDHRRSIRHGHQRGPLCLHVGWKPGVDSCSDIHGPQFLRGCKGHRLRANRQVCAGILQLCHNGGKMRGSHAGQCDRAPPQGSRNQECPRLDAIRDRLDVGRTEGVHSFDLQSVCPGAVDVCPHGDQKFRKLGDLRFDRRILDHRGAAGQHGGHQGIACCTDAGDVEMNSCSVESAGFCDDIPFLQFHLGAEFTDRLDVQVHGPRSPGTAPRERHFGPAVACKQGAEHIDRGAHLFDVFVRRLVPVNTCRVKGEHMIVQFHSHPHCAQQCGHGIDIAKNGGITEVKNAAGEQRCGHEGQRGVLCPADPHGAVERFSAGDDELVHDE